MAATLQRVLNSKVGVGMALAIGRSVPSRFGYWLGSVGAGLMMRRPTSAMVQAVRINQWVVGGERASAVELDDAAHDVFHHTAHCLFDLYHHLSDEKWIRQRVTFGPALSALIEQSLRGEIPAVVAGVHVSNFDLIMRAAAYRGLTALGIAMPETSENSGYAWQNKMRRETGLDIVPASMTALRLGIDRLRAGGTVFTGLDRPLPDSKYQPRFFGRPTSLPVMHVLLALRAKVPVVVVSGIMHADGHYEMLASEPIMMKPHRDRHTEILMNAEAVLEAAEPLILAAPRQWSMFYPVWPQAADEMPTKPRN